VRGRGTKGGVQRLRDKCRGEITPGRQYFGNNYDDLWASLRASSPRSNYPTFKGTHIVRPSLLSPFYVSLVSLPFTVDKRELQQWSISCEFIPDYS